MDDRRLKLMVNTIGMSKAIIFKQLLVIFDLLLTDNRHRLEILMSLWFLSWRIMMGWNTLLRMILRWWRWLAALIIRLSLWFHVMKMNKYMKAELFNNLQSNCLLLFIKTTLSTLWAFLDLIPSIQSTNFLEYTPLWKSFV